jgi:hypothetical protein
MPVGFWGPGGEQRYHEAYYEAFPQKKPAVWTHGLAGRRPGCLREKGERLRFVSNSSPQRSARRRNEETSC